MYLINFKTLFILFLLICINNTVYASPPPYWKQSSYAIECKSSDISVVLKDFSISFGVILNLSPNVTGICDGWIRSKDAIEFLNQLSHQYNFRWYVYNKNLYVSPISEDITKKIAAKPGLKEALEGLGLYEKKFGWGNLEKEEIVILVGPRSYIEYIENISKDLSKTKEEKKITTVQDTFIFPLKYASVVDREINIRDKNLTIPGVLTILKDLLENRQQNYSLNNEDLKKSDLSTLIQNKKKSKISIAADVRTNSIIVQSDHNTYEYYKKIINKLDIQKNIIELDAIIVDINRSKLQDIGVNFNTVNDDLIINSHLVDTKKFTTKNNHASIIINDVDDFYSSIKLLEGSGDASVIANTSIITLENQPAVIDLSETFFIQTQGENVVDVKPVTTGTLLSITPQSINQIGDNKISLSIEIEDGEIVNGNNSTLPTIRRTVINTKTIINEKKSLVIGGYHLKKEENRVNQFPILSKIPIIGRLFVSNNKEISNSDRIFILTPKISPTSQDPRNYVDSKDINIINDLLTNIQNRWDNANQEYIRKTLEAFNIILSGKIPPGFEFYYNNLTSQNFFCKNKAFSYEFNKQPILKNEAITIYQGLVENISIYDQILYEKYCFGQNLIAVTIANNDFLKPGDKSFILVSVEE